MRIQKIVIVIVVLFSFGCASAPPSLLTFATESGATQYFFPMMEWNGEKGHPFGAVCDITYRHEEGAQAVFNLSFTYTARTGAGTPPLPQAMYLTGDLARYALHDIGLLFADAAKRQTRVTSFVEGADLLAALRSASITLVALIDGTEYQYTPSKQFLSYREKFLADIAARDMLKAAK
jgi:hypothetical protein